MNKVYLVVSGEYSDYSIEAVFSYLDKAKEFCSLHNKDCSDGYKDDSDRYDDYRIEEHDLDPEFEPMPKDWYGFTVIMTKDGEFSITRPLSVGDVRNKRNDFIFADIDKSKPYFGSSTSPKQVFWQQFWQQHGEETEADRIFNSVPHFYTYVLARDEQHATRIANERRAQIIALHRWPKDDEFSQGQGGRVYRFSK